MPLGSQKVGLMGAAGSGGVSQYFGDGSSGALDTSGDVTLTVLNPDSDDGDMVLAQYTTLDINSGDTLTVDDQCRGLFIYVVGNCTIAGTLSMKDKGCSCDPTVSGGSDSSAVSATGLRLPMLTASGSETLAAADFAGCGDAVVAAVENQVGAAGDGSIFTVSQEGAAGGTGISGGGNNAPAPTCSNGNAGNAGTTGGNTISTGGGGSGGACGRYAISYTYQGGTGGAFSGGGGSGMTGHYGATPSRPSCGDSGWNSTATGSYGGGGQNASCCGNSNQYQAGGGGGQGAGSACGGGGDGTTGIGGLIWLVVGGDLTITGTVRCDSTASGGAGSPSGSGGGAGGGAAMILYAGTLSNSGTFTFTGGSGSSGGTGGYQLAQVSAA
jgi:hypothetical protein